jgi:hypothetical protein
MSAPDRPTEPHDPQPDPSPTQEAPDRLPTATAATRDPDDPTVADELVAIAPPGKPDGEVDTRPR